MKLDWKVLLLPFYLLLVIQYRHRLRVLRKNLLFTRRLAFQAAQNVSDGQEIGWQIRRIEIKTREILDKNPKGQYTEKIRRKQLNEIEFLTTHYLELIRTGKSRYPEMILTVFPSKGKYQAYMTNLQKLEEEVIQASIATTSKGTKKERRIWFDKVRAATKEARLAYARGLYGKKQS